MSGKNGIQDLSEPKKKAEFLDIFILMSIKMSCSTEHEKSFITLGPGCSSMFFHDYYNGKQLLVCFS